MEYTDVIYLIDKIQEEDDIGNSISSFETSKKSYAKKQSVRTSEFYNAVEAGFNPSIEFAIKKLNYNEEKELDYNGVRYSIIRTADPKNKFDIVLVCSKKTGVKNGK